MVLHVDLTDVLIRRIILHVDLTDVDGDYRIILCTRSNNSESNSLKRMHVDLADVYHVVIILSKTDSVTEFETD